MRALFLGNVAADTARDQGASCRRGSRSRSSTTRSTAPLACRGGGGRHPGQQPLARRLPAGAADAAGAVGRDRDRAVRPRGLAGRRRGVQRVRPRDRDRRIRRDGDAGAASPLLPDRRRVPRARLVATSWVQSGTPHGEVRGSTLGIVGYGRVGREVARRAAPFGCRILAANRSRARPEPGSSASIRSPSSTGCCPNATRWRSAPRSGRRRPGSSTRAGLALMKPSAFLINNRARPGDRRGRALRRARAAASSAARRSTCGGNTRTPAEPNRRGSRHPFPRTAERHRHAAQFRLDRAAWCGGAGTRSPTTSTASRAATADQHRHHELEVL